MLLSQPTFSHKLSDSNDSPTTPGVQSKRVSSPTTCASISTFSRRHSPHTSPISASFPHRHREMTSTVAPVPVALPTLPPLLTQSLAALSTSYLSQSVHEDDDQLSDHETSVTKHSVTRQQQQHWQHHHFHAGVRISSPYRLQAQQRHQRVAPVA